MYLILCYKLKIDYNPCHGIYIARPKLPKHRFLYMVSCMNSKCHLIAVNERLLL